MKLNSYGFSGAYKHPLRWSKYYPQEQFVLRRPKTPMLTFFIICLALVCDEIFLLPFLRLYDGMGKEQSIIYLLVSRQRLLEALIPQKWERDRLHGQSQIILQNSSYWHLSCPVLFITCSSRTEFWISHLKLTQQNVWDKKVLRAYWLCQWPRKRHRTVSVLFLSRKKGFLDFF